MNNMRDAYNMEVQDVLAALRVESARGLSQEDAEGRLRIHGRNELPEPEPTPFWTLVVKQFEDLLVIILLAAAVVSFLLAAFEEAENRLTAFVEPMVILLILIANAAVGVVQETNAEKSIQALRSGEAKDALVIRDGNERVVSASTLVPGDIIVTKVGDKVPADARLVRVESATLTVDEALLTGESEPASKHTARIAKPGEEKGAASSVPPAEQRNCVFAGTLVVRGRGVAVVVRTGANTEVGEIARDLNIDEDNAKTPLQEKLDEFGRQLSIVIGIICVLVWLININHFTDPAHGGWVRGAIYYFKIAVALAVAAIPEGLPAVVTTCLALGTMKMAKKSAVVRSLPSVETLGCCTVICSDKTGTLTANKMSVRQVVCIDSIDSNSNLAILHSFAVEGDGYSPIGAVVDSMTNRKLAAPASEHPLLGELARIATLCNDATLSYGELANGKTVGFGKTGTPTEAALKAMAEKLGVPEQRECESLIADTRGASRVRAVHHYWNDRFKRLHVLEFTRERKSMGVVVSDAAGMAHDLVVKGAPESVLSRCTKVRDSKGFVHPLPNSLRLQLLAEVQRLGHDGLRCIALAHVSSPKLQGYQSYTRYEDFASIESDMTFVGLAAMLDPPRPDVRHSIEKCRDAGIRLIVLTGDNEATAQNICEHIGVFSKEDEHKENYCVTGAQFEAMDASAKQRAVKEARLFSRVVPAMKLELVKLLQASGEIVAMTGDGVNDATALKRAHIGVAMGSGTDVAREASDMVLQDDNFSTIVMAVEEGRAIYSNTKQFIRYLISSNIGEVACIFLTAAIGMPEALIPVQLLWVNLVTDGLPATALGFNPPDPDVMNLPPRSRKEGIVNGWMFFRYMVIGLYVGVSTVGGFIWWFVYSVDGPGMTLNQLTHFHSCGFDSGDDGANLFPASFDCAVFHDVRPSTISLSILVTVEMFNALNALSENQSLLTVPPWSNMWVLYAIGLSFALHFLIVFVPFLAAVFHVTPLSWSEWSAVFWFSFPVIPLDELLKFITRQMGSKRQRGMSSPFRGRTVAEYDEFEHKDSEASMLKEV